jgi:hypothetical protein
MKLIAGLVLLLLATVTAPGQTNHVWAACRHPIRIFGYNQTANLMPLFEWWEHQPALNSPTNRDLAADAGAGDNRPMLAWHRITGVKLGDAGNSWLVSAAIYTAPTIHTNARILLNNPPVVEEQTYYALQSQLTVLAQQSSTARRAFQTATNEEHRAQDRVEYYRHSISKVASTGVEKYSAIANRRHAEAAADLAQLEQIEAARVQAQKQLALIPAANGRYAIDLFALARGTDKRGMLIYDVGVINPGSP